MDLVRLKNTLGIQSFWEFKGQTDYCDSWPLMSNPYTVMIILLLYISFVTKFGPKYMQNRPPYKLDNVLIAYNIFQVILSSFLMFQAASYIYRNGILHKECTFTTNEKEKYIGISMGYCYVWAKISELLDTIFFVLRKKQNQVSFLHVYHHSMMVAAVWVGFKYEANENFAFAGLLNTSVHVIMYTYYGLSAFPTLKKYLWWKKYITTMQLIQFIMIFFHLIAAQCISSCPPSMTLYYFALFNMLFLYYLFNNFYKESYVKPKKIKTQETINDHLNDKSSDYKYGTGERNTYSQLYNNKNSMKKR